MRGQTICARCGCQMHGLRATGMSSLYNPAGDIELCEPCFFDEEAEIDAAGTNNLPDTLAGYLRRLGIADGRVSRRAT